MSLDARRCSPSTARNREPILEVLARLVPRGAAVLEVASGAGEHAVFLAPRLEARAWQPTDPDPESRASIEAWIEETRDTRVLPPLALDATSGRAPTLPFTPDVIFCANMIHIAPWSACEGLLAIASDVLTPDGVLVLYGPYRRSGVPTAPSNESFDRSLRARSPDWGLRDLEVVESTAAGRGLALAEVIEMPANNLVVVFRRRAVT